MVGLRGRNERRAGRALGVLYEEHGGAVFAFALHLCGSREDAEDVVQAAYLHAFRALSAGEQLVNPRAWLMVVVRRQVYNLWRGRRETALAELPEATVEAPDGEAAAELRRVRMVLFSLPEAQHQAFVLRHWSGLSNREIAAVLDTSESAVETLLVRARGTILASGEGVEDACAGVRDRLAQAGAASQLDLAHIGRCKGCGRAQERLARITAAAAVVALVPRAHVAQALAAAVPGFKSGGVAAGLAAGKASAAKLVVAGVLSAGTIAITAPVAMHALHHPFQHPVPAQERQQVAAPEPRAVPETHSTATNALAAGAATSAPGEHARHRDRSHTSETGDGPSSADGTTQNQDGGSHGGDTAGSQDGTADEDTASSGGETSAGGAQGTTDSPDGSSGSGDASGSSSTDGNGQ
jgi:RNA polymerase sigma-70 factor (ECF subfamily)